MTKNKKVVGLWLTEDEHKKLKELAKREHRSVSNLIEVWIAEHEKG